MKARIIQTRYWDDDFVVESNKFTKYLYIYLLTSQYINISGIFQLHDKKILAETDLTPSELKMAKEELTKKGKVLFVDGWVCVRNAMKNNNYVKSQDNEGAYKRELEKVPSTVLQEFNKLGNSSVDSSVDSSANSSVDTSVDSSVDTTQKQEIRNKKKKGEYEGETENFLKTFNEVFGTNYRQTRTWSNNYAFWRESYSPEEIALALRKAKIDSFWKDKATPDRVLRTHHDHIGALLNKKSNLRGKKELTEDEFLALEGE